VLEISVPERGGKGLTERKIRRSPLKEQYEKKIDKSDTYHTPKTRGSPKSKVH